MAVTTIINSSDFIQMLTSIKSNTTRDDDILHFTMDFSKFVSMESVSDLEKILSFVSKSTTKIFLFRELGMKKIADEECNKAFLLKRLLDKKIIELTNILDLTILCNIIPGCIFDMFEYCIGSNWLTDQERTFLVEECSEYIKEIICKHEDKSQGCKNIAECLSKIYSTYSNFKSACKLLEIPEDIYEKFNAIIEEDNTKIIIFDTVTNLNNLKKSELQTCRFFHRDVLFVCSFKKEHSDGISLKLEKITHNGTQTLIKHDSTWTISKGFKMTTKEITENRKTFHLK